MIKIDLASLIECLSELKQNFDNTRTSLSNLPEAVKDIKRAMNNVKTVYRSWRSAQWEMMMISSMRFYHTIALSKRIINYLSLCARYKVLGQRVLSDIIR